MQWISSRPTAKRSNARSATKASTSISIELLALEGEARSLKTEIDNLRAERNAISARFKDAAPEEKASLGAQAKAAGARASELEAELGDKDAALKGLMLKLPGIPWDGAPVGPDESFNTVVRQEGRRSRTSPSSRSTMSRSSSATTGRI